MQTVRYPQGSTAGTDLSRGLAALWTSAKWKKQIVPQKLRVRFFRGADVSDDSESDSDDHEVGQDEDEDASQRRALAAVRGLAEDPHGLLHGTARH